MKNISEVIFTVLAGTAACILICGTPEYIRGLWQGKWNREKSLLLKKIIRNSHLYYPVQKTVRMCPLVCTGEDMLIVAISYADYHKKCGKSVGEIFTDRYYRQYIRDSGCTGREEKMLYEVLEESRCCLDGILLWCEYGDNRTVSRWYDQMISYDDYDFTFIHFEKAWGNRLAKLPADRYMDMLEKAMEKINSHLSLCNNYF